MYKEASKQKLRVQTTKGSLSVEQLWDLTIDELDSLAVSLQEHYETSGKKSFVVKKSAKDKALKLQFDIVLDVLTTKVADKEAADAVRNNKEHNQKILALIAEKQGDELKGKSIAQLEKMLK